MSTGLFSDSMCSYSYFGKPFFFFFFRMASEASCRGVCKWQLVAAEGSACARAVLLSTAFVKCVKIQVVPCFGKYTFVLMRKCLLDTLKLNLSGLLKDKIGPPAST